jgi:hypothetical protein
MTKISVIHFDQVLETLRELGTHGQNTCSEIQWVREEARMYLLGKRTMTDKPNQKRHCITNGLHELTMEPPCLLSHPSGSRIKTELSTLFPGLVLSLSQV